jgi:hypothetical protein
MSDRKDLPAVGLGRLHKPDDRDQKFLTTSLQLEAPTITKKSYRTGPILDQGNTPHCVGYSGYQWLYTSPVRNKKMGFGPSDLYKEAQKVDEWEGEDYDGTSVRGLMKVLKTKGYIPSYYWAFNVKAASDFILTKGPMVFGTVWTYDMFFPFKHKDGRTYIKAGDMNDIVGGHAYLIQGVNKTLKCPDGSVGAFLGTNSWGKSWAKNGHFYISFKDMEALMGEGGEAACATEIKIT